MKTQGFLLKYPDGKSEINPEGNLSTKDLTVTTWQELKDKRDAGKLTPGALYRITDYNCTTTQENTRSAGHLFDIVLLALSENKLAEEGWAMEHPADVYDVTFDDEVTVKCWILKTTNSSVPYNIVNCATNYGMQMQENEINIDEINKTAHTTGSGWYSTDFEIPNLQYSYFQNSNLSAWKVWYCLDNDTSRFAWADNSVDEGTPAFITTIGGRDDEISTLYRYSAGDLNNLFAWKAEGELIPSYTASQTPSAGDTIYLKDGTDSGITVNSFTPAHEGTGLPNGHGVIYRLIDEFNNDCPYDFKNILHIINVKFEDPVITYTFYTLARDLSLNSEEIIVYNNYISPITETFGNGSTLYIIPTITIGETSNNNRIYGKNIELFNAKNVVLIGSSNLSLGSTLKGVGPTIYIENAKIVGSNSSDSVISDDDNGGGSRAN